MKVIIEIPKGDDRRRHFKYDKSGFIDLGPIKDVIPINDGIMPAHYGYIPGTLNEKEGDEIDVLVLSQEKFIVGQEIETEPIALIKRADGDDKVVAVDGTVNYGSWKDLSLEERKNIENFFGYNSKIISIEDALCAEKFILNSRGS